MFHKYQCLLKESNNPTGDRPDLAQDWTAELNAIHIKINYGLLTLINITTTESSKRGFIPNVVN